MTMTIPQTTVNINQSIGIVGQLSDFRTAANGGVDTAINTDVVDIGFGIFVVRDAAHEPKGAKLPSAANQVLKGIAVHSHSFERKTELFSDGLTPTTVFGVLRRGRAFVNVTEAVAPTDHVRVQMVAESGHAVGTLRKTASAGKTIDITGFASWSIGNTGVNTTAEIDVDLNNVSLATAD